MSGTEIKGFMSVYGRGGNCKHTSTAGTCRVLDAAIFAAMNAVYEQTCLEYGYKPVPGRVRTEFKGVHFSNFAGMVYEVAAAMRGMADYLSDHVETMVGAPESVVHALDTVNCELWGILETLEGFSD